MQTFTNHHNQHVAALAVAAGADDANWMELRIEARAKYQKLSNHQRKQVDALPEQERIRAILKLSK